MKRFFEHRWITSVLITLNASVAMVLWSGQMDLLVLPGIFILSALLLSYPSLIERRWQSKHLPPGTIHIPIHRVRQGNELALLNLFDLPQLYLPIKNRYALRKADPSAAGLFLYIYLPQPVYEARNAGPEMIYQHLAAKLKKDLKDPQDFDLIAQRNLPLAFGFRFLPKNDFPYHELSRVIDVVKKDYYRENTKIRGVLQSRRRLFRMHAPEDNEWRTFQPYQEDSVLLQGGNSLSHDFRSASLKTLNVAKVSEIDAERVEYPEKIPFGSLLTYAKKGEISLQGASDLVDKLYIDRVNVLVHGTEHRREILQALSQALKRDLGEEDFYPLFNYGQKLRSSVESGKGLSDYISSHGNFALYYDTEKGWTILKLESRLELRLLESYWSSEPKMVNGSTSLTTSRATLISGSTDSLLRFQISTGTPTRGQILAADEMIEAKVKTFAQIYGYRLLKPVGSGAEGCIYLAEMNGGRFYLKSPDGQLAQEEINTIEALKHAGLIPDGIKTYPEDRMIVLPEFQPIPLNLNEHTSVAPALLLQYLKKVWDLGYLCLDLTPDHVRIEPEEQRIFLIDFSGYAETSRFRKQPRELLADRKKIEYRTPEELVKDFRDVEKFQVYLIGLLFYQLSREDRGLPFALKLLEKGETEYERQLVEDLKMADAAALPLREMLGYDPAQRKNFSELEKTFRPSPEEIESFWRIVRT